MAIKKKKMHMYISIFNINWISKNIRWPKTSETFNTRPFITCRKTRFCSIPYSLYRYNNNNNTLLCLYYRIINMHRISCCFIVFILFFWCSKDEHFSYRPSVNAIRVRRGSYTAVGETGEKGPVWIMLLYTHLNIHMFFYTKYYHLFIYFKSAWKQACTGWIL